MGPLLEKAYSTGETIFQDRFRVPLPVEDGMEDRYLHYSFNPIFEDGRETSIDDSGAPIFEGDELRGIVLVFRNIEERRAAERENKRITDQLSQVLNATTDAIISIDRNWVMTYLNPSGVSHADDRLSVLKGTGFREGYGL